MKILETDRLVFFGDSITEWGRDRNQPSDLGTGFIHYVGEALKKKVPHLAIYNRGIGGDHLQDLLDRLEDCTSLQPTKVVLLIGINDVWHQVGQADFGIREINEAFESNYRTMLQKLQEADVEDILLLEPFVLPYPEDRLTWRVDLDQKRQIVEKMAQEFQFERVALDHLLNEEAKCVGAQALTGEDGVHPTPLGARIIANQVLSYLEVMV
ncbi:SGNH/GDSL hydrolase family protein [Streptococcus parasanguinis]|uniref:SGNH/GDSL hydrolase family protein n=1 Tax=Streptococcus parasanguinis TaxID=1318 RepID=UPI0039C49D0D